MDDDLTIESKSEMDKSISISVSIDNLAEEKIESVADDKIIYECDICKKTFDKNKNLKRHRKLHFEESKIHRCNLCEKVYNRSDHLKRHMVVHASDRKPFKCPYCILRYSYQTHLKQHIEKNHVIKADLNHYCVICKIHFNKKSQLHKHNYIHTGEKAFKCYYPFCDKSYFNEGKLNLHIQKSHILNHQNNNINNNNNTIRNLNQNIKHVGNNISNNMSENISTCLDNNDLYKINSYSANNFLETSKNGKQELDKLNNEQSVNSDYDMLLKIKRIDKIKDVEDLRFIDNLNNTLHCKNKNNNSFHNKKKSRKFSSEVFVEKKEKSFYKCPISDCIKTYTSPYNLKVHIKTFHYKIQQFKCQVCGQVFNHKCSLNSHILKTGHINSAEDTSKPNVNTEIIDLDIVSQKKVNNKINANSEGDWDIRSNENSLNENSEKFEIYSKDNGNEGFDDYEYYMEKERNYLESIEDDKNFGTFKDKEKFGLGMDYTDEVNEDENLLFKINPNFFSNN